MLCDLKDIVEVAKKYRAYIYLDEAHSIGALGRSGRGCCEHWGVDTANIDVMMGTFTKSFGSCGGYIAGSHDLINHLRRHGPAHLYAAAISPAAAQQILSAMKLIDGEDGTTRGRDKVQQLHDNANYVRRRLLEMGLHVLGDWNSPVMPIMIYHSGKLPVFSRQCLENNVAMVVVGFPATSVLLVRARVCISAAHSTEDLEYALEVIDHVANGCCIKYRSPKEGAEQVQKLLESAPAAALYPTAKAKVLLAPAPSAKAKHSDTNGTNGRPVVVANGIHVTPNGKHGHGQNGKSSPAPNGKGAGPVAGARHKPRAH